MARPPSPGPGPVRTCVGCRARRPVDELTRITRRADGSLLVGRTLPGRGAWLCRGSAECLAQATRQGGFGRAFRSSVRPDQLDALRVTLADHPGGQTDFVPGTPAARD